jgi:hypothetical protein
MDVYQGEGGCDCVCAAVLNKEDLIALVQACTTDNEGEVVDNILWLRARVWNRLLSTSQRIIDEWGFVLPLHLTQYISVKG